MPNMAIYCCCGDPCVDCDPGGAGTSPNSCEIDGAGCVADNTTVTFFSFGTDTTFCRWTWEQTVAGGNTVRVDLFYTTANTTFAGVCPSVVRGPGLWRIRATITTPGFATSAWEEDTTGFACSGGKISGTHTFATICFDFASCNTAITLTVDP